MEMRNVSPERNTADNVGDSGEHEKLSMSVSIRTEPDALTEHVNVDSNKRRQACGQE